GHHQQGWRQHVSKARPSSRWFSIAIPAVLTVALAACTSAEGGSPRASEQTTTTTTSKGGKTTTSKPEPTTSNASPLDDVDPCGLLSEADLARTGVGPGEKRDLGKSRGCRWTKRGDFSFSIGFNPDLGLKDLNYQGATPRPIQIGKHEATTAENIGGGEGQCTIFIGISEKSSVHLVATASGSKDTAKACEKALMVAKMIDPKLP
ncbi:MAG: DUF3558 domain-containing protein, partial [bacterium]